MNMKTEALTIAVLCGAVLLTGGLAIADTHAPWPADWNNWSDPNLMVTVGDPGNAADTRYDANGFGSVSYEYKIGKYEVTAGQYTEFLNAVAKTDTYSLYNTSMDRANATYACNIVRTGSVGSYAYSVDPNWANRPVNYVSWGDSARFANWLHNGQPTGAQGLSTTEDGAYFLNGATSNALLAVNREADWKFAITSEDEWYKAAYYKGSGTNASYWDYPTSSDAAPGCDMNDVSGNNANYSPYPMGKDTTLAGEFQNSDSPYGTFDQGGNVWEWNEAIFYSSDRGVRGGSFSIGDGTYAQLASCRSYSNPTGGSDFLGFRVVEVPEPASMALLALGGLALLRRRPGR